MDSTVLKCVQFISVNEINNLYLFYQYFSSRVLLMVIFNLVHCRPDTMIAFRKRTNAESKGTVISVAWETALNYTQIHFTDPAPKRCRSFVHTIRLCRFVLHSFSTCNGRSSATSTSPAPFLNQYYRIIQLAWKFRSQARHMKWSTDRPWMTLIYMWRTDAAQTKILVAQTRKTKHK